jgi:pyridoxamine 5'-phosphate oxidase
MQNKVADLRQEYSSRELSEDDIDQNPFKQFGLWFNEAVECKILEPNVMALATVKPNGNPACRIVLLKGYDENGFVFFTNYNSEKGIDIENNPFAALTFLWLDLERQVRIEGSVEKIAGEESDAYFNSRPEGSRLGTWASPQSQPISKKELLDKNAAIEKKYEGMQIPRPPYWGGYIVKPEMLEFWQGRPSRLHDRIAYYKAGNDWRIERLAP